MKKTYLLLLSLAFGLVIGFVAGNHGPRFASGYATGQLDLVLHLHKHFPHDQANDTIEAIENYDIKNVSIRVINKNGIKTLDVHL